MEFNNSFDVPLRPAEAWPLLLDIQRLAPCLPGAELTEVVDENTYKGRIAVRLGPVALIFAGTVKLEAIDSTNHTARVQAQGSDAKGRGGANAATSFRLEPAAGGSTVLVHTDLALSGAVAQYGRGVGIIQATAAQIVNEFANNLRNQIAAGAAAAETSGAVGPLQPPPVSQPPGRPISGFFLIGKVIWSAIVRLFTRR